MVVQIHRQILAERARDSWSTSLATFRSDSLPVINVGPNDLAKAALERAIEYGYVTIAGTYIVTIAADNGYDGRVTVKTFVVHEPPRKLAIKDA